MYPVPWKLEVLLLRVQGLMQTPLMAAKNGIPAVRRHSSSAKILLLRGPMSSLERQFKMAQRDGEISHKENSRVLVENQSQWHLDHSKEDNDDEEEEKATWHALGVNPRQCNGPTRRVVC